MYHTKNSMPEEQRMKLVDHLGRRLADAIDLMLQVKQACWNVKGPHFISLHELFDHIAKEVEEDSDRIAERILQLGGSAEGTARAVVSRSSLADYPLTIAHEKDHITALATVLAAFSKNVRYAIEQSNKLMDPATAALFTEILRDIETWLRLVEAHVPMRGDQNETL